MILPDVLESGLDIVFCGTAVGGRSAKTYCYYAGPGNQFWPTLRRIGLVPEDFKPQDFRTLPRYGLGLTDLVKSQVGNDVALRYRGFDVTTLRSKIVTFSPKILAFNGKKAAEIFFGQQVDYGLRDEIFHQTRLFVLPSTSGAARGYWNEQYWIALATLTRKTE